ncbi:BTAD domain-containing putative transcriptional regulator [Streptomyces sp. CA-251247]|uniref:AfsR/SARP family transcriptional regulator n=1 Tax=Streptomyces sp. CA-251247 TaxID=3240062 RepID=UPI003D94076B
MSRKSVDYGKSRSVQFRTLGPLSILTDGRPIPIAAEKQRTVVAMLITHRGNAVPVSALLDEVWGGEPPQSAVPNLRTYVMQLRRLLQPVEASGPPRLITSRSGYALRLTDDEFDIPRFLALTEQGRRASVRRDMTGSAQSFRSALALWRGDPFEDVMAGPTLREATASLIEQYLNAVEGYADTELALGQGAAVVEPLRRVVRKHPLRERLHRQLMVALYQSGDVASALGAFTDVRATLRDELGMDPGQELSNTHQAILRRDPELMPARITANLARSAARPVPEAPRQLPRKSTVFVGREQELADARQVLNSPSGERASAPVMLLHGPGGRGKSALALRIAHAMAESYVDGQLYADLQDTGFGARAPLPVEVLGRFLRALGVPRDDVPTDPAEAAARYQSMLAGRRTLIVLDNVLHRNQVAPLLPAEGNCAVLVTSRSTLPALDAVRIPVAPLNSMDSVHMLAQLIGERRVAAEPDMASEISRLCQGNPLALTIVGARCISRPGWHLSGLTGRLRKSERRLDELQVADLAMRSCYATSYEELLRRDPEHEAAAEAFRRLSFLSSPFTAALAAETIGSNPTTSERILDELVAVGLLDPVGQDVYRMPDLVRLYARELADHERLPPHASTRLVLTRPRR